MYRDQLCCILTPPTPIDCAALTRAVEAARPRLQAVLLEAGDVHYATLFFLPPPPRARGDPRAAVGFELAVDEGVDIDDLLRRIATIGVDCLWPIFGAHTGAAGAAQPERIEALARFLIGRRQRPDGGFVGARDLTVMQARQEAALYRSLHAEARGYAPLQLDRAALARRLSSPLPPTVPVSADANRDLLFPWATRAAPASPWCRPSLRPWKRALRILRSSAHGALMPVALVAAGSLLAVIGTVVFGAAQVALTLEGLASGADDPGAARRRLLNAVAVAGSSVGTATAVLVASSVAATLLVAVGIDLWLRRFESRLVASVAIQGLLVFVVIAALAAVQLAVDLVGPASLRSGWLPVSLLLGGWGLGWLAALVIRVGLAIAAIVGAVLVIPPYRSHAVLAGTAALFFSAACLCSDLVLSIGFVARPFPLLEAPFDMTGAHHPIRAALRLDAIFWIALTGSVVGVVLMAKMAKSIVLRAGFDREIAQNIGLKTPRPVDVPRAHQTHESIVACEAELFNRCNHMISLTEIRPPVPWHRFVTRVTLRAIGRLADTWFVAGMLGQATGIHFAHWYLIDEGRRLLFLSNYDGDFSGYLDEFIHGASEGVNLIWRGSRLQPRDAAGAGQPAVSHARDFPRVRRLVLDGCASEQWFKVYVRDSMLPHLYRFEAYDHSLQNLLWARRLRNARCAPRSPVSDDCITRAVDR